MAVSLSQPDGSELLSRWVVEHARAVRGFLLGMVRKEDVADDLLQDVFRRAWQARERYREQGQARAFLMRIADRLVCDRARRLGVEINVDFDAWQQLEPAVDDDPTAPLLRDETGQALAAALDQITPIQRRVLLLRFYGGMEFAEVAKTLGAPLNTVLSHCRRGLLTLRKLLAENLP